MKGVSMAAALGVAAIWAGAALAEPAARVAIHVDENDPQRLNMVLDNAQNIDAYYDERGEEVEIAIVAYGPGLHMLREDTSPVRDRVEMMAFEHPNVTFRGCQNTADAMTEKEGAAPEMIEGVTMVESGAQHLIELQQQGWPYLRP
jgi:intracellular sulfur oxidation DsrE/DsrF family protein